MLTGMTTLSRRRVLWVEGNWGRALGGVVTGVDYQHRDVARSDRRDCDEVYVVSRHDEGAASAVRVEDFRESAVQQGLSGCESVCILSLIHLHLVDNFTV